MIGSISEVTEEVEVSKTGVIFKALNFFVDKPDVSLTNELFPLESGGKFLHEVESLDEGLLIIVISELVIYSLENGLNDCTIKGNLLLELLFEFVLEGYEDFFRVFFDRKGHVILFEVLHDGQILLLSDTHSLDL